MGGGGTVQLITPPSVSSTQSYLMPQCLPERLFGFYPMFSPTSAAISTLRHISRLSPTYPFLQMPLLTSSLCPAPWQRPTGPVPSLDPFLSANPIPKYNLNPFPSSSTPNPQPQVQFLIHLQPHSPPQLPHSVPVPLSPQFQPPPQTQPPPWFLTPSPPLSWVLILTPQPPLSTSPILNLFRLIPTLPSSCPQLSPKSLHPHLQPHSSPKPRMSSSIPVPSPSTDFNPTPG